jgi:hypothetical protein
MVESYGSSTSNESGMLCNMKEVTISNNDKGMFILESRFMKLGVQTSVGLVYT